MALQKPKEAYRELYPSIKPYDKGHLKVDELHEIYYEQSGNKNGNPVLYV